MKNTIKYRGSIAGLLSCWAGKNARTFVSSIGEKMKV